MTEEIKEKTQKEKDEEEKKKKKLLREETPFTPDIKIRDKTILHD